MQSKRLVWLTPESEGGIRTYADALWPEISLAAGRAGMDAHHLGGANLKTREEIDALVLKMKEFDPTVIHVQHEFGLFGSKIYPFYRFPELVRALRERFPKARLAATAHSVLSATYRLPLRERRKLHAPGRWLFNSTVLPFARRGWMQGTWGVLDGVLVHSRLQQKVIEESGCPVTRVIPHFVPVSEFTQAPARVPPTLLVFGYFSAEKGQDILIQAMGQLKVPAQLICAGGLRRPEDKSYLARCRRLVADLGIAERVRITGFVMPVEVDEFYRQAHLVVAPFRETSGSGSLAHAFARGMPILASDLALNQELGERVPGCLATFRTEDPADCARQIEQLLGDAQALQTLRQGARKYAQSHRPAAVARQHVEFYGELLARARP